MASDQSKTRKRARQPESEAESSQNSRTARSESLQRSLLRDGSVPTEGFFDGLNRQAARITMQRLVREFDSRMVELDDSEPSFNVIEDLEEDEDRPAAKRLRDSGTQEQFEKLELEWLKNGWGIQFGLCEEFPGKGNIQLNLWNQLLTLLWKSLEAPNLRQVQELLINLRSEYEYEVDWTHRRSTGYSRTNLQANLLNAYHQVCLTDNSIRKHGTLQRFQLLNLFESHEDAVRYRRRDGTKNQIARQSVNSAMVAGFSENLGRAIDQEHLQKMLKKGKHWSMMVRSKHTAAFGYGLLLLLPYDLSVTLSTNTAYPIWEYFIEKIPQMDGKLCAMAVALQDIGKVVYENGSDDVTLPMVGFEMMVAEDLRFKELDDLTRYWRCYPEWDSKEIVRAIQLQPKMNNDLDHYPRLVRQEWEAKNRRDMDAIQRRREANERVHKHTQLNLELEQRKLAMRAFTPTNTRTKSTKGKEPMRNSSNNAGSSSTALHDDHRRVMQEVVDIFQQHHEGRSDSQARGYSAEPIRSTRPVFQSPEPVTSSSPLSVTNSQSAIPAMTENPTRSKPKTVIPTSASASQAGNQYSLSQTTISQLFNQGSDKQSSSQIPQEQITPPTAHQVVPSSNRLNLPITIQLPNAEQLRREDIPMSSPVIQELRSLLLASPNDQSIFSLKSHFYF